MARARIDDRSGKGQAARDKADTGDGGNPCAGPDRIVTKPVPSRPLLEHILETAEERRHQRDTEVICPLEQAQVGLVDLDEQRDQHGHHDSGHEIDVEEPIP